MYEKKNEVLIDIYTKDNRIIKFSYKQSEGEIYKNLSQRCFPNTCDYSKYAEEFCNENISEYNGWKEYDAKKEFERQGVKVNNKI